MPSSGLANTIHNLPAATSYANPESFVPTPTPYQGATVQGASSMPPIAIAAGIGAAGQLASGLLQNRGQNKAIEAQTTANDKAIAYQREQDATRQKQWEVWQGNREALLKRYGVDIGSFTPQGPAAAAPAGAVQGQPQSAMGRVPMGSTMGELMGQKGGAWNDWGSYGLRSDRPGGE